MSEYVNERVSLYTFFKNYIESYGGTELTYGSYTSQPFYMEFLVVLNSDYTYSFKTYDSKYLSSTTSSYFPQLSSTYDSYAKWTITTDSFVADDRICIKNVARSKYLSLGTAPGSIGTVTYSYGCSNNYDKFLMSKKSNNRLLDSLIGLQVALQPTRYSTYLSAPTTYSSSMK